MLRKLHFVLAGLAFLFAGMSWASPRWSQDVSLSRIFAANLGSEVLEARVEKSRNGNVEEEVLRLAPGELVEVRRSASEEVSIPDHPDLLLVTAPAAFDPSAVRFGARPGRRPWEGDVRIPFALQKAAGTRLSRGETAASQVLWTGAESLAIRLGLHGKASAEVRATRPDGTVLGYVTLSASRDVEVTVDLRGFVEAKGYGGLVRQEVFVRRGQVSAPTREGRGSGESGGLQRFTEAVYVGTADFNTNINFTQLPVWPLYYEVTGGPASTCGELNSYRNNSWLFGANWLCTNASGYSQKGPWTSAPTNQTDDPLFIRWPDGSTTTNEWHIWDISCPSVGISATPPSSWSGTATDTVFGVCFRSFYGSVGTKFLNVTTGYYWDPAYGYGWPAEKFWSGSIHSMPTCNTTWGQSSFNLPPLNAHVPGNRYRWTVCLSDGGCRDCKSVEFVY